MPGLNRSTQPSRVLQAVLLAALLGFHFVTRFHAQQATALQGRHFYSESYFVSLSLLAGRGFGYLLPAAAAVEQEDSLSAAREVLPRTRAARWVVGFMSLAGQEEITDEQLLDYLREGAVSVRPDPIETTRVLDIYVAAALWRLFGISWTVYFAFYALVSTLATFCVFLIARQATGSYWVGFVAAGGFLVSPLESYSGVWSTRDTAPLWFTAIMFGSLTLFSGPAREARAVLRGAFVVGFAAFLGLGWRPDVLIAFPTVLGGLVLTLARQPNASQRIGLALTGLIAGGAAVLLLLRLLGPPLPLLGGATYHIAWYGEATRSNLLQTENAFQVVRDDRETLPGQLLRARPLSGQRRGRARAQRSGPAAQSTQPRDVLRAGALPGRELVGVLPGIPCGNHTARQADSPGQRGRRE